MKWFSDKIRLTRQVNFNISSFECEAQIKQERLSTPGEQITLNFYL